MFQSILQNNNSQTEYAVSRDMRIRINHVPETPHPKHEQSQRVATTYCCERNTVAPR